mgnify:CR=1 FL=1
MAFENLSDKLSGVFKRLRSKGKLSESDVKAAMREVRLRQTLTIRLLRILPIPLPKNA